jgi:hypothetical protein
LGKPCPKCKAPALSIAETQELIENFAQMAEYTNTDVEMISDATEEGQMLKNSFGGIAAILRFKLQEQLRALWFLKHSQHLPFKLQGYVQGHSFRFICRFGHSLISYHHLKNASLIISTPLFMS